MFNVYWLLPTLYINYCTIVFAFKHNLCYCTWKRNYKNIHTFNFKFKLKNWMPEKILIIIMIYFIFIFVELSYYTHSIIHTLV